MSDNVDEYLRRNMLHAKAVGAAATAEYVMTRLMAKARPPKWLVDATQAIIERALPVADEMAAHRDEIALATPKAPKTFFASMTSEERRRFIAEGATLDEVSGDPRDAEIARLSHELDEASIAEVALDVDYEALRGRYMAWQARAEAAERRAAEEPAAIVAWLRAQASEEVCGDFFADVIHSFVAHCIAGIECGEHNKQNVRRAGGGAVKPEDVSDESVCSVCSRLTGFGDEDKGEPPVNLARCPSPGGLECRAVAQAVAPLRRENEVLRSNSDHLSSENASLVRQVESMAMRIESLAEELAKPEDVRLREVLDALDGRAVIFDGLGARVGHLLDEMDEWIERAGAAERRLKKAEEVVLMARQLTAYAWEDRLEDCEVSDSAKHDSRELSTAVWLYDQEAKS